MYLVKIHNACTSEKIRLFYIKNTRLSLTIRYIGIKIYCLESSLIEVKTYSISCSYLTSTKINY